MQTERFDIIIIGSGAGGGTIAHALAPSSARILVVERGDFVPQEEENWNPEAVWKHLRYRVRERWLDRRGREFQPYTHYCVGGNTKFWGSVLYRLRREDFQAVQHVGRRVAGVADRLRHARAVLRAGRMPLPGPRPARPRSDGAVAASRTGTRRFLMRAGMATIVEQLRGLGLHPSPLPLGLLRPARRTAASCATRATRFRARSTRRATPTSAASGRCCSTRRSRSGPTRSRGAC